VNFRLSVLALLMVSLLGCGGERVRPQTGVAPAPSSGGSDQTGGAKKTPIVEHNLSRVATAQPVSKAQLEALEVGRATRPQVLELLGENRPFTLGDGKTILRYDVGKFIFDQQGVLLRKFLAP
jgi:hypothetical protein